MKGILVCLVAIISPDWISSSDQVASIYVIIFVQLIAALVALINSGIETPADSFMISQFIPVDIHNGIIS
ncbi:hypothetical protein SAMN04487896_1317 [Paenibacillus sp. ov031]|nr:hypothetical protein SAMN05428961_1251 [Paenibacillus sp. OK060]SHN59170.1 hypothetical protein SAMN04487896_1317 [Paenibacillus sp. ov031]